MEVEHHRNSSGPIVREIRNRDLGKSNWVHTSKSEMASSGQASNPKLGTAEPNLHSKVESDKKKESLATLVHRYLEGEEFSSRQEIKSRIPQTNTLSTLFREKEMEDACSLGHLTTLLNKLIKLKDAREETLHQDVVSILRSFNEEKSGCSIHCRQRFLLSELKHRGYNAAICESQWSHTPTYYGGDFEYMDVLFKDDDGEDRLLIDIDFGSHFQIARPTPLYAYALDTIPPIFVGREPRLLQLVDLMGDAASKSLKANKMLLPPWRKLGYLRIKWLAQHSRIVGTPAPLCTSLCRNTVVFVRSNQARGTDTSPIVLDLEEGLGETDLVYYKGRVFDMKHENIQPSDRVNYAGAIPFLQLNNSKESTLATLNTNWEFPAVSLKSKKKSALTACFVESELSKQLRGERSVVK